MEQPSKITYIVYSLDVWGHGPKDCKIHICSCINKLDGSHELDMCDCCYQVDTRTRIGELEVITDKQYEGFETDIDWGVSDEELINKMKQQGFMSNVIVDRIDVDGEDEDKLYIHRARDGYPLFELEFEKAVVIVEEDGKQERS